MRHKISTETETRKLSHCELLLSPALPRQQYNNAATHAQLL